MQNLQVRSIIEADWEFLSNWKDNSIPREILPGKFQVKAPMDITEEEEKTLGLAGYVVCKGDTLVHAAWLYMTNSKIAFVSPMISNNLYNDTDKELAEDLLLHFIGQLAIDMRYTKTLTINF